MYTESRDFGKVYRVVGRGAAMVESSPLPVCPACLGKFGAHTWECGVAIRLAAQFVAATARETWRDIAAGLANALAGAAREFWYAVRWADEPDPGWTPAILCGPRGPAEGRLPDDCTLPGCEELPIPTGSVLLEGATRCRTYQQFIAGGL